MNLDKEKLLGWLLEESAEYLSTDDRKHTIIRIIELVESGEFDNFNNELQEAWNEASKNLVESAIQQKLAEDLQQKLDIQHDEFYNWLRIAESDVEKYKQTLNNIMGVEEAAELWNLSPGYIKNLCASGKVKAVKIGKTWVIDKNQRTN